MKQVLILAAGVWLLAGCTVLTSREPALPVDAAQQKEQLYAELASFQQASADAGENTAPVTELTPALLYQVLVGEVAVQRDELEISAFAYRQAALHSRDPRLAQRATQIAVYNKDYAGAGATARLWAELAADSMEAQQSAAALLLREGEGRAAIPYLQKLVELSPNGPAHGFMVISSILTHEAPAELALPVMDELARPYGKNEDVLLAHANLAYQHGDYPLASSKLGEVLARSPKLARALVLQANILHKTGKSGQALEFYEKALHEQPADTALRLGYARMLLDTGQVAEARKQFARLGRELPGNVDVLYVEGLLAAQDGDVEVARQRFLQLIQRGERDDEAAYALGQLAERQQNPEEALHWYDQVSGSENYLDAVVRAAVLINQLHGLQPARDYLHNAELQSPGQEERLRLVEAELLQDAGQPQAAHQVYDSALRDFPDSIELLYARAMNAERLDRIDLLEADLRSILRLEPGNVHALNALGYTLADRTGRYEEAHELIRSALDKSPNEPAILDSMGWVLYRLGRLQEAEAYLRRSLAMRFDGEIAAHLGEVLWMRNEHDEARKVWEDARERDPQHRLLQQTMERFLTP